MRITNAAARVGGSSPVFHVKQSMQYLQRARTFVALLVLALVVSGCTVGQNPLSGRDRVLAWTWEQEEQIGREADQSIQAQYGAYDEQGVAQYVERLGQEVLAESHLRRPETDERIRQTEFHFRVLDSPIVNAFALPGGYVYVTRGLMAHLNNEAQLAVVLGHEVGHVAGRHASRRAATQQLTQLGLIGLALGGEAAGLPGGAILDVGGVGAQLLFLRYSREDEREADRVGVEYSALAGYEAGEGSEFFRSLRRLSAQEGPGIPNFLATHPDPGEREQTIQQLAAEWRQRTQMTRVGQGEFLQRVDGMVLGQNPRHGFAEGGTFFHPEQRFRFPIPSGFQVAAQGSGQVVLVDQNQQAQIAFREMQDAQSAGAAAADIARQDGIRVIERGSTQFNNIPAQYLLVEGQTQQGQRIRALLYFLEYRNRVYGFQGASAAQNFGNYQDRFEQTMRGFQELTDQRILNVQPTRITVQSANRTAPFSSFINEDNLPRDMTAEELAIMNQVELNEQIEAGRALKLPTAQGGI